MHPDQAALEAELARQDAAFAEILDALHSLPADTELGVSAEWLEAIEEAATLRAPIALSLTPHASMRC